ncbi:MAG: hypothetical protein RRY34_01770, partial [Victivallaceae bacterium]
MCICEIVWPDGGKNQIFSSQMIYNLNFKRAGFRNYIHRNRYFIEPSGDSELVEFGERKSNLQNGGAFHIAKPHTQVFYKKNGGERGIRTLGPVT